MYRAGLESILGFKLIANRQLQINPCVPRWWRDFEITYRRERGVYRIRVENPLGVSRGVVNVEVDGVVQADNTIDLVDDEKTHNVRIVMGEPVKPEESQPQAISNFEFRNSKF
jgi:cyclic beta-1,2-glucan synthetase